MRMIHRLLCLLLLTTCTLHAQKPVRLHRLVPQTAQDLQSLLRFQEERPPFVSAHRGGPAPGFPENCIATFEHTLQHTFAMLEVDPRRTKDGAIVLHHDATLERTSTGTGKVADHTLAELKQLRLKDTESAVTSFSMPTLDEAIEWARGKTVLVLDQKDVTAIERAEIVTHHKAEAHVVIIVSSFADAAAVYRLNPNILMEVMMPTVAKAEEFGRLGVPWKNVVAFVGHTPPDDPALYAFIHRQQACCMIGTSRNIDRDVIEKKVAGIQELGPRYRAFLDRGADLIETDIPVHLGPLLFPGTLASVPGIPFFEWR